MWKAFLTLAALALLPVATGNCATYYASPKGTDGVNTCTMSAFPCTAQGAMNAAAKSGASSNVVHLKNGIYSSGITDAYALSTIIEGENAGSVMIDVTRCGSNPSALSFDFGAVAVIKNLWLRTECPHATAVAIEDASKVTFQSGVIFDLGQLQSSYMYVETSSYAEFDDPFTLTATYSPVPAAYGFVAERGIINVKAATASVLGCCYYVLFAAIDISTIEMNTVWSGSPVATSGLLIVAKGDSALSFGAAGEPFGVDCGTGHKCLVLFGSSYAD
jgi:hypothetical protein